jgi:hypothetical protein
LPAASLSSSTSHTRLDAGGPRLGVDVDSAHALGLDQDRVLQRLQGNRAVAGALAGDAEVVRGGEAHGLGDVLGALGEGDAARVLVGGEVPGGARLVPVGVGGCSDAARDREAGEFAHVGSPRGVS